jgi:hypothetical protein
LKSGFKAMQSSIDVISNGKIPNSVKHSLCLFQLRKISFRV